jgi:hypothetical protein
MLGGFTKLAKMPHGKWKDGCLEKYNIISRNLSRFKLYKWQNYNTQKLRGIFGF